MVFELTPREGSGKAACTPPLVSPMQGGHTAPWPQEQGGSIFPTNPPPKPAVLPLLSAHPRINSTFTWGSFNH